MNRITQSLLVIGVSSLFLLGCSRRDNSPEGRADWLVEKVSKQLELTADQRARLNTIKTDILARKDLIEAWKHSDVFDEVLGQLKTESMDKGKLNTLLAQKEAKRAELRTLLVDKAAEFHAVLTPQQRAKAAEKLGRFREHFGHDGGW